MIEVYDKAGNLMGYVRGAQVEKAPLSETRQKDERKREEWLSDLVTRSITDNWSKEYARDKIKDEVPQSNLVTSKGIENLVSEAMLAVDVSVRHEFSRLKQVRDQCWAQEQDFLRKKKHGPSQVLIDMLRRQKRPGERMHVSSAQAYLNYLRSGP